MPKSTLFKQLLIVFFLLPLAACADKPAESVAASEEPAKTEAVEKQAAPVVLKAEYKEGEHFVRLPRRVNPTVPVAKIEVVELFWYGCPHCFNLEPHAVVWKTRIPENVVFRSVPAVLNPSWATHARAYYAAEKLGLLKNTHETLFKSIHEQGRRINSEDALLRFFERQGADREEFKAAMHSSSVEAKVKRAEKLGREYGLTGVPSLVVDGQYRVLLDHIASYEDLFSIVDFLIVKVRKDRLAAG